MQTQSWQYPTPLSFPSKTKHTATVIILHGLGDTAHGWADFAPMLQQQLPYVKFVFPTAPTRPITLNGGMRMTGWFDILSLDKLKMKEDKPGLQDAVRWGSHLFCMWVRLFVHALGQSSQIDDYAIMQPA